MQNGHTDPVSYEKVAEGLKGLREDGFANRMTGMGTTRDPATYTGWRPGCRIADETLVELYSENDLAAKIMEIPPFEMFRPGFDVVVKTDEEARVAEGIEIDFDRSGGRAAFIGALIRQRVLGMGAIYLAAGDGRAQDQPINPSGTLSVLSPHVLDRRQIKVVAVDDNPQSARFGQPELYEVSLNATDEFQEAERVQIHYSRVLSFDGIGSALSKEDFISELSRIYHVIAAYESAFSAAGRALQIGGQGVYSIKNFLSALAQNQGGAIRDRLALTDTMRGIYRGLVMDADGEDFTILPMQISGLDALLKVFGERLSAASRLPMTLLFGTSPGGLNATGQSDIQLFYDRIAAERELHVLPNLRRYLELLSRVRSGATEGSPLIDFEIQFRPPFQMSEQEQADLQLKQAQSDKVYLEMGVLLPDEVRQSRFTSRGFSLTTQIDDGV